jgi:predicted nucleotidyltransferase
VNGKNERLFGVKGEKVKSVHMADPLIKQLKKGIEPIAIKFHLDLVVLFGSAARGHLRPDSDLDLGFVSHLPLMRDPQIFQDFRATFEPLENDFGRDIDLVEISSRNLLLLKRIWKEGILLFESQPGYWLKQRLHWRFLVEDNIRYTMNYSILIGKRLEAL